MALVGFKQEYLDMYVKLLKTLDYILISKITCLMLKECIKNWM